MKNECQDKSKKPEVKRTIICIGQKYENENLAPTIMLVDKPTNQTLNKKKVINFKFKRVLPIQNIKHMVDPCIKQKAESFYNISVNKVLELNQKSPSENKYIRSSNDLPRDNNAESFQENFTSNYVPKSQQNLECTSNGIEVVANYIVGTENIITIKNENMETEVEQVIPTYDYIKEFTVTNTDADIKTLEDGTDSEPWLNEEICQITEKCRQPQHFIVDTVDEFKRILRQYEHDSLSCFQNYGVKGNFYKDVVSYDGGTIHFKESGRKVHLFNGAPFSILGKIILKCHQGVYYRNYNKWRIKSDGEERKRYKKRIMSKKMNCPVRFVVTKVLVFPDYHVDPKRDSKREATRLAKFIKEQKHNVNGYVKYVFTLPSVFDHKNHKLGLESISREAVDKRVIVKMEEYIKSGIIKAPTIKALLQSFIQHELKIEESQWTRRKYNPSLKDIRGKINRTLNEIKQREEENNKLKHKAIRKPNKENIKKEGANLELKKRKLLNNPKPKKQESSIQIDFNSIQVSDLNIENNIQLPHLGSHSLEDCDINHKRKSLHDHISQLGLLVNVLKGKELSVFENDIIHLVNKWTSDTSTDQLNGINKETSNYKAKKRKKRTTIPKGDHSY